MTVAEWNAKHPVGTRVLYWPISGPEYAHEFVDTVTRSEAWELGHGAAVVKIQGRAGGVLLEHLVLLPQGGAQ